jgi:hypothetical protein
MQASLCLALFADGCLLVMDLRQTTKHAIASTTLLRPAAAAGAAAVPCCMEVACTSSSATSQLGASSSSSGSSRGMRLRASSSNKAVQGSGNAAAQDRCVAAVGYSDGSTVLYELSVGSARSDAADAAASADSLQALQQLLAGC